MRVFCLSQFWEQKSVFPPNRSHPFHLTKWPTHEISHIFQFRQKKKRTAKQISSLSQPRNLILSLSPLLPPPQAANSRSPLATSLSMISLISPFIFLYKPDRSRGFHRSVFLFALKVAGRGRCVKKERGWRNILVVFWTRD